MNKKLLLAQEFFLLCLLIKNIMNKKKKYIVIGSVALLILITSFLFLNFNKKREPPLVIPLGQNYNQEKVEPRTRIPIQEKEKRENLPTSPDIKNIKVSLNVLDKTYTINIEDEATVYNMMKNLQSIKENNFSFKAKEYSGLGYFIDEINGIKGAPGKYWIYYVNNIEASVGVSKYILEDGDSILWKQE